MTASTPPLVDVIAELLAGHQIQISTNEGDQWSPPEEDCTCSCGEEIGGWVATGADWEWPDWTKDHAAHQARAVLASLTKAGGVEWGVRWEALSPAFPERTDVKESAEKAQTAISNSFAPGIVVSRVTGPWAAVEGL